MDNFYNSVNLAEQLDVNEANMCETLQKNCSGNPEVVIQTHLKKGEYISRHKGNVTVMKWKDNRDVLTMSTAHGPETEDVTNKRGIVTIKPRMVVSYDKNMNGIDRSDQMPLLLVLYIITCITRPPENHRDGM